MYATSKTITIILLLIDPLLINVSEFDESVSYSSSKSIQPEHSGGCGQLLIVIKSLVGKMLVLDYLLAVTKATTNDKVTVICVNYFIN